MGLFFPQEPIREGQGRPVGFARYRQVLERDWKRLFVVGLLTLAFLIPLGLGILLAVLTSSVLLLIPGCILGGLFFGPGIAGMYDMILRCLRDNRDDWWYSYKKAMKQNWRAALGPGVVFGLFAGFLVFCCAMLWWSQAPIPGGTVALLLAGALAVICFATAWWPQLVLFDQRPFLRFKNCILFGIQNFWRLLAVGALQVLWWLLGLLFMPWTAFLVPFLGVWYILFLAIFLMYDQLNQAFGIEKRIAEAFPEQACRD